MRRMNFNENYNGKLAWPLFTTIRLDTGKNYEEGEIYRIELRGEHYRDAQLVFVLGIPLGDIPDSFLEQDTGLPAGQARALIREIYGDREEWYGEDGSQTSMEILIFRSLPEKG